MARLNSVELLRDKEAEILYRAWDVADPFCAVILVHGLGAHSARWQALAEFFNQNRIACYGIELKGFGETPAPAGHVDSFEVYLKDIFRLYDRVRNKYPQKKIFLLGESLGGLIAFATILREPEKFSGLVCVSPAFRGKFKFRFFEYLGIIFSFFFNRRKRFRLPFKSLGEKTFAIHHHSFSKENFLEI